MSAVILSIAARQPREVQQRAAAAAVWLRERQRGRWSLGEMLADGRVGRGITGYPSLDAWYRAQPVPRGRLGPVLRLSREERPLYGLPVTARLVELRGIGGLAAGGSILVYPVTGGHVVGVKAPDGSGVGVIWRKSYKANDYALRLAVEHGLPIRDTWLPIRDTWA